MAQISRQAGTTSHVTTVFVQDATRTDGGGLTGLTNASAGLVCYYKRNRGTASVQVPLVTITTLGTYVSGGFKEVDSANWPGLYEFHPPDAAMASGAGSVSFSFKGATNMVQTPLFIELTATNSQDGVAGGMTALPAFVAGAANGLPVLDASSHLLAYSVSQPVTAGTVSDKAGYSLATAPPTAAAIATAVLSDVSDTLGADIVAIKAQTDKFLFDASNFVKGNTQTTTAAALDNVVCEGMKLRAALGLVLDMVSAKLSGVPSSGSAGNIVVKDAATGGVTRATIGVDGNGNRTSASYAPEF